MRIRQLAVGLCVLLATAGCGWHGVDSLPLPGATGRGSGAAVYHVEMANVGTLVSNSPVMIDDVTVGSVGAISVRGWHADVEVSVKPDVVVPANVVATIGQTSLLGSTHLALNPPPGAAPSGRLQPGATVPIDRTSTYPSTEQTLASLSVVLNGGGMGQINDIIHNLNAAFSGREGAIHDLIPRLDAFMTVLDQQRDNLLATVTQLNRMSETFAQQRDTVSETLQKIGPALDVLLKERPNITTALDKLHTFSDTATGVISQVQSDLLTNLRNLEPALQQLADVGPKIPSAASFLTVFPYGQYGIDHGIKGDYINLFATIDLTVPRLQRELLLGTPWGDPNAVVQAMVGDPGYGKQTNDPLGAPLQPPADSPAPNGGGR
ncbi:MCE family protein MceE [Nocardia nova SH22a]|uniref:MCE family protein MceE n=1 Tax=Nocardia nova SH22a TaxID=1415166 RepID=W5TB24_9NOCA|nr:MCE family protein [Nocardia nova]AHH16183.1 MCE family protein MceE [Nocardia nova SH22a]